MRLPFTRAPKSLCILRLSAVGDVCHTLPIVRTIQTVWPQTRISWIIGKSEFELLGDIGDIEFFVFDKSLGLSAYTHLYRLLGRRRFDALLHLQMSLRSCLINRLVNSDIRLGFDRARAKDLQWLFNNASIPAHRNQHVMDSLFGFCEALGIRERVLRWDIPIPATDRDQANRLQFQHGLSKHRYLVISPCSAMAYRNWNPQGYAAVCDGAGQRGLQVVLTGGRSRIEKEYALQITRLARDKPINLIGQTNLKQLLVLLADAIAVVSPDSGPAHLATAVNTPVVGLYACTNPDRARPYLSESYVVNHYPEAVLAKYGKPVDQLPWGIRVRDPGTMDRIKPVEVLRKLDKVLENTLNGTRV